MTPTAVHVYDWPLVDGEPPMVMYRISGGDYDGSDVTAETLERLGIPVPSRVLGSLPCLDAPQHAPTN